MSLVKDWHEKHQRTSSKGRVLVYLFLLVMVILFIIKADSIVSGFTRIFFPADTTAAVEGRAE
jgi:ACR3 family arsenite efflux pump ArsB